MPENPLVYDFPHKQQTKACDCWYACIQMLLSWREGVKAKPKGQSVMNHRNVWAVGRTLDFGTNEGDEIKRDNGLVSIGNLLDYDDIGSVHDILKKYGPFIVGGTYGPCGLGHFVVIGGVNTNTEMIYRDNPAWGYGKAWKNLSYLKKVWPIYGTKGTIDDDAVVALKPL